MRVRPSPTGTQPVSPSDSDRRENDAHSQLECRRGTVAVCRATEDIDSRRKSSVTRCGCTGIDAPICQDTRSGGLDELLASAKIGHDSLVDLASEKTFQAPDDLPFGSAVRRAACDVINGRLMVPHADDDGAIKGGVGLAVAAPIEPVPAGGHPGRGRERTRTAELREGGFRTNPVGIVAEDAASISN